MNIVKKLFENFIVVIKNAYDHIFVSTILAIKDLLEDIIEIISNFLLAIFLLIFYTFIVFIEVLPYLIILFVIYHFFIKQ